MSEEFDARRASNRNGGTVRGNILTVDDGTEEITYTYDLGNNRTETFTLISYAKNNMILWALLTFTVCLIFASTIMAFKKETTNN